MTKMILMMMIFNELCTFVNERVNERTNERTGERINGRTYSWSTHFTLTWCAFRNSSAVLSSSICAVKVFVVSTSNCRLRFADSSVNCSILSRKKEKKRNMENQSIKRQLLQNLYELLELISLPGGESLHPIKGVPMTFHNSHCWPSSFLLTT